MLQFFLASSPIFAVVALGFAAARLRLVAPQGFSAFAAYAFNLALPALMTSMLARQPLGRAFEPRFFLALLAAGLAVFVAVAVLAVVLGVAAGAALGLSGLTLPGPVDRLLTFLGGSAGPVALFALGGALAAQRLGEGWRPVLGLVAAKLVVYPAVAWLLLRAGGLGPDWVAAGTLLAALPTAAYAFVFAQRFEAAPERISAAILISTLAGAVTFPLTAWLVLP